jgi:hypothetical protein
MHEQLTDYTDGHFWTHLTLPTLLDSIEKNGLETGHPTTEEQLFSEYFPESSQDEVVELREYTESLLERVRKEVHGESPTFADRRECVALWPSVERAYDMRSAVLGDSVDYGMVIVDVRELENPKMVLSEYEFIAQSMVHAKAFQNDKTDMGSDELVEPALYYWRTATLTNSWTAVGEQTQRFELPEVLIHESVSPDAIVDTLTLPAEEYDDENQDVPPTVSPK